MGDEGMADRKIKITAGGIEAVAVLNDGNTAVLLWDVLPIKTNINTWGDEIYFSIPVKDSLSKDAVEVVEKGDIAYWPSGAAFCIFWGKTPASQGNEIRPASSVNLLGKMDGNPAVFAGVPGGSEITIERI